MTKPFSRFYPSPLPEWRIVLAEYPSKIRGEFEAVSHPLVAMVSPSGCSIAEIHGVYLMQGGPLSVSFGRMLERLAAKHRDEELNDHLYQVVGKYFPRAVLELRPGENTYPRCEVKTDLYKGDKPKVTDLWNVLQRSIGKVNGYSQPYYRYATTESPFYNCQKLLREAINYAIPAESVPDLKINHTSWALK